MVVERMGQGWRNADHHSTRQRALPAATQRNESSTSTSTSANTITTTPPMFRKPRPDSSPASVLGQPPSSLRIPSSPTSASSPRPDDSPAIKKQKTTHITPRPRRPRQSQLTAASFTASQSSSTKKSTPLPRKKSGKNGSILNFFKPVGKDGAAGRLSGAGNDDLFLRHGGYGLDVSDPEESEDEDAEMGPFGSEDDEEVATAATSMIEDVNTEELAQKADTKDLPVVQGDSASKECTPPPEPLPSPANSEEMSSECRKSAAPKFNAASLKIDFSKSMLFGSKQPVSSALAKEGVEPSMRDGEKERDNTTQSIFGGAEVTKTEQVDEQNTSSESNGMSSHKEEDTGMGPSNFNDDEFADIDDFQDEEIPWEEREGRFDFDPAERDAARFMEEGYVDENYGFDEDVEIVKKPPDAAGEAQSISAESEEMKCPICQVYLGVLSESDANNHVNHCLDGNPIPLPAQPKPPTSSKHLARPAPKETQSGSKPSAFTTLMSTNSEAQAWSAAAKAEEAARGKRAAERSCPFYKKLFDGPITVDAFRYGAVPGCNAYFLSHFHSDHYVGLTARWNHGPIYCSRVTANLVRTKLMVDPQYVKELPWEEWVDVPETEGIRVRGLDANHCPGSMLFLFEKDLPGKPARIQTQRILHCGDFRAHPKHLNHPLLRPGKERQRIDVCYLDTTYLNPKYAFPSQESVISACAAMCVSLNKEIVDKSDSYESARNQAGVSKFVKANNSNSDGSPDGKKRGRLLVVIGTYSIGKERVALGIARAMKSKLYGHPSKQKTISCLEDPELNALLTTKPAEAQVHMTPLQEISAEALKDYLDKYPMFDRVVGFRPSGWNYRPPNSRLMDSPKVSDVLYSQSWKSPYSMTQITPQRGSTRDSKCFAVPYSEHSSFRELSMFCCALEIGKIIPTVNVGSAPSRQRMKSWIDKWEAEKRKNGLFFLGQGGGTW